MGILEGEEGDSFEARLDILSSVPIEVAHLILGYLGVGDVVRCSHVSSAWYSLTNYNPLWKRLCYQWTWNNTRMVDDYRTHRFQMPKIKLADLEPTCRWKTNFERNYRLPKRWARGECVSYDLRVGSVSSQVTCFHSDGDTLAVGHADSTVSTFDVERLPRHLSTAGALLADKPVTAVRTDSNNIVVVQGGLVQIMRRPRGDTFEIVSCKSLEVCSSLVEVWERLGATVGDFEESYLSLLSAPGAVTPTQQQILVELKTEIYCAVRGRHLVYSWCPQTGQRTLCLQLPGHPHSSLKDVTVHRTDKGDRLIHTLFSSRSNSVRLACYSVASGSWMFEVGCGCCRVESLLSGTSLLVGMVRSGSILCWQLNTGRAIPSTVTSRSGNYLRPGTHLIFLESSLIAMGEGSLVQVWDLGSDSRLAGFTVGGRVGYLRAAPFSCLLVFTQDSCCLWHWPSATKLYTLYLRLRWCSDYNELLYLDPTMILSKNADGKGVQMTTFC